MFRAIMPGRMPPDEARYLADCRLYYERYANDPSHFDLIADAEGEPAGSGGVIFEDRPPHVRYGANLCGYVLNIYVLPEFRRRGIARSIMLRLISEARARGTIKLRLHASDFGRPLYESLGFKAVERYLELEEDAVRRATE
jgi:GNAT superfamily N-acetyltransferase